MNGTARAQPEVEWIEPAAVPIPTGLDTLASENLLVAQLLVRRGITTPQAVKAFMDPSAYFPADPFDLPDMERAVERIETALRRGEQIGVWGDFDVDGQTSTTLLVDSLRALGGKVSYHIPVRARESHGVNLPNLKEMLDSGAQLVITCDTGITAHEAALYARQRGADYIITDHHTLPPVLPAAMAAVNPQRLPEGHPLRTLPGVGTAYEVILALCQRAGRLEIAERQLDLAALGIVADLATLTGDARYLAQRGLLALRKPARLGLQVLLESAETNPDNLSEEHISFVLAPRLNAIGRLDDANPVVDFLTTTDLARARVLAARLEGLNAQRKMMCDQVFKAALEQVERTPALLDEAVLVLSHPQWPAGVVGIVASRMVELYHRPAILLCAPPGEPARGSARSVEGINIIRAITACQDMLGGFGGHPMAAGLSLEADRIPELRRRLHQAVLEQTGGVEIRPQLEIDAYIPLADASLELVEQLERLAPFGPGNPAPVLSARGMVLKETNPIGKDKEHLKLVVEDEAGGLYEVLWWQGVEESLPDGRFDLAYSLHASNFRGQRSLQVEWAGMRAAEQEPVRLESAAIQIVDYRLEFDPDRLLKEAAASGEVLVWQEGENISPLPGCGRANLSPARVLAVWNIPPGASVLHAALDIVKPEKVILFGLSPSSDQPPAFLARLAGLARYALTQKGGLASLREMAAACGQRESTVLKGLQWLAARGNLTVTASGDELSLSQPGKPDPQNQTLREKEMLFLLEETAAYRDYYLRADPRDLIRRF